MNKSLKVAASLLLAVAVVMLLLYLSLPVLTGLLAQQLLKARGVSQPRVEVSGVNLDTLRIRSLRFVWNRIPVVVGPVEMTYGLAGVLEGRADAIRIEQGRIVVPVGEDDPGGIRLPTTLPSLPLLPFEVLTIEALTFEFPEKPPLSVKGRWKATGNGLRGGMVLSGGGEKRAEVAAEWRNDAFWVDLFAPGDPANPWARLHLNRTDAGLETEAALDGSAESLRAALTPWWQVPLEWQGRGQAMMEGRFRRGGFAGKYSISVVLKGTTSWTAELEGRASLDSDNLTVTVAEGGRVDGRGPGSRTVGIIFPGTFRAESRLRDGSGKRVDAPVLTGDGDIVVEVEGIAERLSGTASLADPILMLGQAPEAQTVMRATGKVRRQGRAPIEGTAAGPLQWVSGSLRWRVQPEADIAIPEPYAGAVESPLRFHLRDEVEIAWRPDQGWRTTPAYWWVDAPRWEVGRVHAEAVNPLVEVQQLRGEGGRWEASGVFAADSLQGFIDAGELPPLALQGRFTADPRQVTLFAGAKGPGVSGNLSATHRLEEHTGTAHWKLDPVTLSPDGYTLASLYRPWPFPFDVGKGEVEAGGYFQWQAVPGQPVTLTGEFDVEGKDLGGYFRDLLFSGADSKAWLALDPGGVLHTRQPAPLTIDRMTTGIPSHGFQTRLAFRVGPRVPLKLQMERPSVELLGGRVLSDVIEVDFTQAVNRFEVELEHIALDRLLDLEQAPVEGLGRISGTLPLRLSEEGLAMDDGHVTAVDAGVIRYRPGEESQVLEKSDENIQLAIAALRDFHYESLKASADYAPSGWLDLRIGLLGSNPELFEGRSVQFNINVEENIPDLLRSLRAGRELEGQIDDWVQDFYRRRQTAKQ